MGGRPGVLAWPILSGMTGVERADVMVRMHFGPNNGIAFSPDGALLAVCSAHHTEIIDASAGRVLRLIRGHSAVITETVFNLPGIGRWGVGASQQLDIPAVTGFALIFSGLLVVANLFADVLYAVVDPRIRLQ